MFLKPQDQGEAKLDWLKWLLALVLLLAGVIANHYYSGVPAPLRMLIWLALLVLSAVIISWTRTGKWVVQFFLDARMELRKVVWPKRDEVMQTTLVVAAMVIILALILWGLDGILIWLIGWLTGQRG